MGCSVSLLFKDTRGVQIDFLQLFLFRSGLSSGTFAVQLLDGRDIPKQQSLDGDINCFVQQIFRCISLRHLLKIPFGCIFDVY